MLKIKYIFLIWIILLIIFTIYSIYKLKKTARNDFNNVIDFITKEQAQDSIMDIKGCENIYDDNIAVRALGYNNCSTAFTDYYNKSLDINKKYGNAQTLGEICPVSTGSDSYMNCMKQMLEKYNTNATILDNINTDMTNIINERLQHRSDILNDMELSLKYEHFANTDKTTTGNPTTGKPTTGKPTTDKPTTGKPTTDIEQNFFGEYIPIKGQYKAFNELRIYLGISPSSSDSSSGDGDSVIIKLENVRANATITYTIGRIKYYKNMKNVIELEILSNKSELSQTREISQVRDMLRLLGVNVPGKILLAYTEDSKDRKTYKIMNLKLDTIIIMDKIE